MVSIIGQTWQTTRVVTASLAWIHVAQENYSRKRGHIIWNMSGALMALRKYGPRETLQLGLTGHLVKNTLFFWVNVQPHVTERSHGRCFTPKTRSATCQKLSPPMLCTSNRSGQTPLPGHRATWERWESTWRWLTTQQVSHQLLDAQSWTSQCGQMQGEGPAWNDWCYSDHFGTGQHFLEGVVPVLTSFSLGETPPSE